MSYTEKVLSNHVYDYLEGVLPRQSDQNYLEIGVFNGVGTARLARAFPDMTIYAVDPFIEDGHTIGASQAETGSHMSEQKAAYLKNSADNENQILFEMTSSEFARTLTAEQISEMNIAWVLIDGNHHYEHVTVDYEVAMRLIGPRAGHIVFDDMQISGVSQAYGEFIAKYADRVVREVPIADGVARSVEIRPL